MTYFDYYASYALAPWSYAQLSVSCLLRILWDLFCQARNWSLYRPSPASWERKGHPWISYGILKLCPCWRFGYPDKTEQELSNFEKRKESFFQKFHHLPSMRYLDKGCFWENRYLMIGRILIICTLFDKLLASRPRISEILRTASFSKVQFCLHCWPFYSPKSLLHTSTIVLQRLERLWTQQFANKAEIGA